MPHLVDSRVRRACLALGLAWAVSGMAAEPKLAHRILEEERAAINPRYLLVGPGGQAVTNEDFRGRFQLIAFGYTYCPDVCPTTLVEMTEVLKALGDDARRVQPVFISIDPERDTSEVLKTYTAFFDPRIVGLTGPADLVRRAAQNFRVRYAKAPVSASGASGYSVDHSAGLFLLGPDGQLIRKFAYGRPVSEIVAELRRIMPASALSPITP